MKAVIAMDSFKGSLTSMEAGNAVMEGICRADASAQVTVRPLADGGEGTVEALAEGMGGRLQEVTVTGPLGSPVSCTYGIAGDRSTAILEMSGAAGITLVPPDMRNPLYTTTYGVGEVIRDAVLKGCRRFIVGIGGSATNDGGVGMLQALGFEFLDREGGQVPQGAQGLKMLSAIRSENALPQLADCTFRVACDVTNVLCGKQGCSAVYGPQKGATPAMIREMDRWLADYAALAQKSFPHADPDRAGSGAAGGLGFAFGTFLHAALEPGAQIVLEETGLEAYVKEADIVITGEGCLDAQTAMGKAPAGVAGLAKKHKKPVIAFAGSVAADAAAVNRCGIDAFFPILRRIETLKEAMQPENAKANLADTAEQVFRLWQLKAPQEKEDVYVHGSNLSDEGLLFWKDAGL